MLDKNADPECRSIPFPYRAMLAICSDLDETPDWDTYFEITRFLNTREETSMGPGVDLEVGNTIYFDMPPDQFAYWNTDDRGREMVRTLIRSGHVDCLHSFGDLATSRADVQRSLDELVQYGCRMEVWIDHAVAASNFGADIMCGSGDDTESEVYHADLTVAYGIRFVSRGRVTSVIGQEVPRSLGGVFDTTHPWASARTWSKEALKGGLARLGHRKYAIHGPNRIIRRLSLRDGQMLDEFLRANPFWGGVQHAATADGIAEVLTRRMLDRLVRRGGVCVLYTHLGKTTCSDSAFASRTVEAFRVLAEYGDSRRILVTTTRRLLRYCAMMRRISVSTRDGNSIFINTQRAIPTGRSAQNSRSQPIASAVDCDMQKPKDDSDGVPPTLDGLTLYVTDSASARVSVNDRHIHGITRNERDHTGRPSISFKWPTLEFPAL